MMYECVTSPLTLSLSREGRGDALRQFYPLPLREREGPGAQRREGEGEASHGRVREAAP